MAKNSAPRPRGGKASVAPKAASPAPARAAIAAASEPEAGAHEAAPPATVTVQMQTVLLIRTGRGRKKPFRRAGMTFGPEPREMPLSWLKPAEAAAIRAEPALIVTEEERPAAA